MRRRGFVGLSVLCVALSWITVQGGSTAPAVSAVAPARDAVLTVYPTGIHPTDIQNVQAALDAVDPGGTVILKSTDTGGNPLAFNFGGTKPGDGGVVKLLRPDITLAGDGWNDALNEPKTKIVGGGGPFKFSSTFSSTGVVFAVNAAGVTIRELKLTSGFAYSGVIISSANQQATDDPVVVENNDLSVLNYAINAVYSGAFPVTIRHNSLRSVCPIIGQWIGFTLAPIVPYPYDQPVAPTDAGGAVVRYPFTITGNTTMQTPGTEFVSLQVLGWLNTYSQNPDPEVGVRRLRPNASSPWVYQYVQGDNGPVVISGNDIVEDSPGTYNEAVILGSGAGGVNHVLFKGNRVRGECGAVVIEQGPYGHDNRIEDNDFSAAKAYQQVSIDAADTTLLNNVFGPVLPLPAEVAMPEGIPQPAVTLISVQYNPGITPMPNPVEHCVIARNDYRRTGLMIGSVLVASQPELQWAFYFGTVVGTEVKNNMIFESGGFPPGTGQAGDQILLLAGLVNPATSLPYVYDNRVIGLPARGISSPGIGSIVRQTAPSRRMLFEEPPMQ